MATMEEIRIWLEVGRNLFPKAGFAVAFIALVYLARQTWKTREDWRYGLPWSGFAHYVKRLHQEFGYAHKLDCRNQTALFIVAARPEVENRFNPREAYDLDGLLSLAVYEKKMLLITGAAGSGKTALLHTLALRASLPENHRALGFAKPAIPFYLPLKFIQPDLPFVKALALALQAVNLPLSFFKIKRALRKPRALLLFDGLEEITGRSQRQNILRWLEEAKKREAPNAQIVIACRSEALLGDLELNVPHFKVAVRNFAVQKILTLRAVTDTRMPTVFRNPHEREAEYILISPPTTPGVLRGAAQPIPPYHYYLAKYPITNAGYRAFVQAGKRRAPAFWCEKGFDDDRLPVVGIDWEDAESYCAWLNELLPQHNGLVFRLPSEAEWEWAASANVRLYPWGDNLPEARRANFGDWDSRLTAVQAHPEGATPEGLCDMVGNVWEWTATETGDKPAKRIVRGGAAYNDAEVLKCVSRDRHAKEYSRFIGFRVARVPQEFEKI